MKSDKTAYTKYIIALLLAAISIKAEGQLTASAQLRTRSEFRDGQGTLTKKGADPAFFTSQRTRFTIGYSNYRIRLYSAIQDVRVWGQDASTINRTTTDNHNGLMVHEAWAEVALLDTGSVIDNFSLKVGRQELLYDDSRLLGNLDWLQQGRRHDAALLKFSENNWQGDLGLAFNQNAEFISGNIYNGTPPANTYPAGTNTIGTMYKAMQFLYLKRKFKEGYCSFLFLKDDFNRYHMDSTVKVLDNGVWSRLTTGLNYSGNVSRKVSLFGSAFLQRGKSKDGADLSGWFVSFTATYNWSDKFSSALGSDWLSGNTANERKDKRFDPLYGTPHKFWGYMDYFYVASPSGISGLKDYFLKFKIKPSDKFTLLTDVHEFYTANRISSEGGGNLNNRLGTEVDIICLYSMTKELSLEAGYCTMMATSTMASPQIKNVNNANTNGRWAYLMLNINTQLLRPSK